MVLFFMEMDFLQNKKKLFLFIQCLPNLWNLTFFSFITQLIKSYSNGVYMTPIVLNTKTASKQYLVAEFWTKQFLFFFWKNWNSRFFRKHSKLFWLYLNNQILIRGRSVFKTNSRISSITSYKDHCYIFFTSWVIKQQKKLYFEHFEKTPNFRCTVRTLDCA